MTSKLEIAEWIERALALPGVKEESGYRGLAWYGAYDQKGEMIYTGGDALSFALAGKFGSVDQAEEEHYKLGLNPPLGIWRYKVSLLEIDPRLASDIQDASLQGKNLPSEVARRLRNGEFFDETLGCSCEEYLKLSSLRENIVNLVGWRDQLKDLDMENRDEVERLSKEIEDLLSTNYVSLEERFIHSRA